MIAVLVGVLLVIAGVVGAHAALNAQTRGEAGTVDRGVVDVTTTLGLSTPLESAAGTGIVLTSTGEILTNNHVIRGATSIVVTDVTTGRNYTAFVVGYDENADVALLQLQSASGLAVAKIGNSSTLSIGNSVVAVGNVGGVGGTPTVTNGTVIGLDRSITATDSFDQSSEQLNGMIETNANIRPGDSGGPLENGGQVVGMDTAGSDGFAIEAGATAGFAIPIDEALAIGRQIQAGQGSAAIHIGATAYIGVGTREELAGATVEQVESGSPAAAAGIVKGDVITSLDGNVINTPNDIATLLVPDHPGQMVTLGFTDTTGQDRSIAMRLATGPAE